MNPTHYTGMDGYISDTEDSHIMDSDKNIINNTWFVNIHTRNILNCNLLNNFLNLVSIFEVDCEIDVYVCTFYKKN